MTSVLIRMRQGDYTKGKQPAHNDRDQSGVAVNQGVLMAAGSQKKRRMEYYQDLVFIVWASDLVSDQLW